MIRTILFIALLMSATALISSCRTTKVAGPGDIVSSVSGAAAHWISSDRLIWDSGPLAYRHEIRFCQRAGVRVDTAGVSGGTVIPVGPAAELSEEQADRFRHIAERPVFGVDADAEKVRKAVKGQIIAIAYDRRDQPVAATRVQFPGLIDQYFYYDGELGPVYSGDALSAKLWAPTALSVTLQVYDAGKNLVDTVQPDMAPPADGVWRFSGTRSSWDRAFYRFEVSVYHHGNNRVNTYEVTDPYSVSLAMDSRFSQFADPGDADLKPSGWEELAKELPHPSDITLYEAHIRDFSIHDLTVPKEHRGTFMAFRHNGQSDRNLSDGMAHLSRLSEAGLTHLHLLPVNDIATVNENPAQRVDLHMPYRRICDVIQHIGLFEQCEHRQFMPIREAFEQMVEENPATHLIQKPYSLPGRMRGMAALDGFNWGYDPFHFNAPEGSYATDPDGVTRILELRKMVQSLAQIGLHVVVDVVYNHTFASGPASRFSVLDKVVPGYYHRYDPDSGAIETSTCCDNTAAEHAMMEKLILDSVLLWAKQYKIDSFRFDLMGHHPRSVMERLRKELAALTLQEHQVDGANIYIYGEGWNFGEVADDRLFVQATQRNMGGTGIGNFNDRSRDAIRGGNFTNNGRAQGFVSGRFLFPNEEADPGQQEDLAWLLDAADRIRVGMSGNLATYPYVNREGRRATGGDERIGFALQPQESVNYIDKHDNETFWDNTQAKLPLDMGMDDRVRVHMLGNAFITFGQGVPFYQMGTDILRSKSLDRNSFDSGDWFNAIDFSLESHRWAQGLPPAWDNESRWDDIRALFRDANVDVRREHMELAHTLFREQLRIRYSSPLFRLRTADDVHKRLAFHNTGPDQEPGLIAMTLSDGRCAGQPLDSNYDGILVLFNADNKARDITLAPEGMSWEGMRLHPVQQQGADPTVRQAEREGNRFRIPALTVAVFVMPRQDVQGEFVCN